MAMNPLHTQHRQDLERVTRAQVGRSPGGNDAAVLGETIEIQTSDRVGVRRSVEGLRKLWVHPVLVGSAVLLGKELILPALNCYVAVWLDAVFGVGTTPEGIEYNNGDMVLRARWECVPVEKFDLADDIIVPSGADIITSAGDSARYSASFGVVVAETREVPGSDYRLVSRTTNETVQDTFIPYFFQMLIPNPLATPPLALF